VNRPLGRERLVLNLLALGLAAVALSPFLWLLQMSFKTNAQIFTFPPQLLFAPTFENYEALWSTGFRQSFVNSLVVSTAATVLPMALGVPGAYALSRWQARAASGISLGILASRMAPPIAFTVPYFLAYRWLGLLDTRAGLVLICLTLNLSLVVWTMRPFFDQLPRALEEAAWIDGAGYGQAFRRVVLPLALPGVVAGTALVFILCMNAYATPVLLGGPRFHVMGPQVYQQIVGQSNWPFGGALAFVLMATTLALTILSTTFIQRRYGR
jgi:multiple sugar transport system permease protein